MRRRITLAILGTVTAALVLTGLGTLVLDRVAARNETESELRDQAAGLAVLVAPSTVRGAVTRPVIHKLLQGFELQGIAFVYVGPRGGVAGEIPAGAVADAFAPDAFLAGQVVSGHDGRTVYAMAPASLPSGQGVMVAVLTRQVDLAPGRGFRWFVISAAITLLLGALVSVLLSRALTQRLRAAEAATHRIATGDLSTRLPAPPEGRTDEISDLSRSINTMAEGLERSRALEQQFLLSVSHDLRTPLTSIRGYAEAINDGTVTDAVPAARVILSESRRLERLVGDLLDLARLDARRFTLHVRPVPVGEVVARAAEGFRPEVEAAGLTLVVEPDRAGALAEIDVDRLAQVVANLVQNGFKHARTGLHVATSSDPVSVTVVVDDDGPGIAADDLPHVFERLYVARHRPARQESGSGLGLAIVRELVGAMGGEVRAESPTGPAGGTRMVVRLPRTG